MGTTADKLARLNETKVSIKTAINDPTLGDKFADYPTSITNGKAYIAQKITEKGVEASGSDTFQQLGDKVGEIEQGGKTDTVNVSLKNLSSDFYMIAVSEYGISPVRESTGTFSNILKGSVAIYPNISSPLNNSGDVEYLGIISINGFSDSFVYRINGDCSFSTGGGGGN